VNELVTIVDHCNKVDIADHCWHLVSRLWILCNAVCQNSMTAGHYGTTYSVTSSTRWIFLWKFFLWLTRKGQYARCYFTQNYHTVPLMGWCEGGHLACEKSCTRNPKSFFFWRTLGEPAWSRAVVKVRRGSAPCSHLSPPAIVWAPLIESIKCYFTPK